MGSRRRGVERLVIRSGSVVWLCMLSIALGAAGQQPTQRNEYSFLRGKYNLAFFYRHYPSYAYSAAFHFYHARQHDVLQLTPLTDHTQVDLSFDAESAAFTYNKKSWTEPSMELFGAYTAMMVWRVYRAIDWTHMHHEQTYDIMADRDIEWQSKPAWTERSVRYYLTKNPVAMSCAPLDITMRRAAVMMKPYFTYYRNYYPRTSNFAYVAHWWHPVIYEAMMVAGNGGCQEEVIGATNDTMLVTVLVDRPKRMLLSREAMPRYSRMSPESANIFDNLHMLHGVVYDIMAYEGWTREEKRDELYRVVDALSYKPGDEKLARKFTIPYPDMDPRVYYEWMKGFDGAMNRIMLEMLDEMWPMMMPENMSEEMRERVLAQTRMKLLPGFEQGEIEGSLGDALRAMIPGMKTMSAAVEPGVTPEQMSDAMLQGWREKYGDLPDVGPYPMNIEPASRRPAVCPEFVKD